MSAANAKDKTTSQMIIKVIAAILKTRSVKNRTPSLIIIGGL